MTRAENGQQKRHEIFEKNATLQKSHNVSKLKDWNRSVIAIGAFMLTLLVGSFAWAHCDQMDGPVVIDAQAALEDGVVTPILKWVPAEDAQYISEAFDKTLVVRKQSPEAKELADRFFFETLVRIHRASEGVAFTGLKPAGTPISPGIAQADKALEKGNVDELATQIASDIEQSIRQQFELTMKARAQKDQSVGAGRDYVAEYVPFVHYVKKIHEVLSAGPQSHKHAGPELEHNTTDGDAEQHPKPHP